jgi:hypothetical protein
MRAAAREEVFALLVRKGFVERRVKGVLLAQVMMLDQVVEHPFLVQELVSLASTRLGILDQPSKRFLGRF